MHKGRTSLSGADKYGWQSILLRWVHPLQIDGQRWRRWWRSGSRSMIELMYGAKDFARIAGKEIREGRPVAIRGIGWRKGFIYRTLALYADFDRRPGSMPKKTSVGLALRVMLVPQFMGLCHLARSSGMEIVMRDQGSSLEVK